MPKIVPSKLWQNGTTSQWQETLDGLSTVVNQQNETFTSRHSWYTEELPDAITSRQPPHMTKEELVKLVEWKLTRGSWRPKLVDYAKATDTKAVVDVTTAAFKTLASSSSKHSKEKETSPADEEANKADAGPSASVVSAALEQLTKPLKGVGPATASLILAAFDSSCPFMSDEAIAAACGGGKADYTLKVYMRVLQSLRDKAAELSHDAEAEGTARRWTAVEVEQCLFVEALVNKQPESTKAPTKASTDAGGSGSKRKRAS